MMGDRAVSPVVAKTLAIGLVVGYVALDTEAADRTLQHLVAADHSRRDILLGKFLARSAVVAVTIVAGAAFTAAVLWGLYPGLPSVVGAYVLYTVATVVFGVAVVALAVGVSASCRRPVRAATGSMGAFVALVFLWDLLPAGVYYLLRGGLPGSATPPDWYYLLVRLNPIEAYLHVLTAVFEFLDPALFDDPAVYLSTPVMIAILLAWILLPLAVGTTLFERADLQ
jgi:ABC-2 type transport system permease protein